MTVKQLQLGALTFPTNLIQGPLAGVSCAPFRRLVWEYSQPAYVYSEMISCKTLLYQVKSNHRFIAIDPSEGPVCFQLSAGDPQELAEVTKRLTDLGASLIDLNCGCPVNKIRSRGAGSSLLSNPQKLYQLISAMKRNTHLPVSVKIRVDGASGDTNNAEVAKVVGEAGADCLVVHGRHWTEHYETSCHYHDIQFFVEAMQIPVIGNGDVACVVSLRKMLATGCAGVMIARAGVGQPWLIEALTQQVNNHSFQNPRLEKIGEMYLAHVEALIALLKNESFAVIQARKLAKYYGRQIAHKKDLMTAVNQCTTLKQLQKIIGLHFVADRQ